jgi:hypothetical protein
LVSIVEIIDDVSDFVLKELKLEGRDVDVDVLVSLLDVGKVEIVVSIGELNFVDSEVTSRVDESLVSKVEIIGEVSDFMLEWVELEGIGVDVDVLGVSFVDWLKLIT